MGTHYRFDIVSWHGRGESLSFGFTQEQFREVSSDLEVLAQMSPISHEEADSTSSSLKELPKNYSLYLPNGELVPMSEYIKHLNLLEEMIGFKGLGYLNQKIFKFFSLNLYFYILIILPK
ncbi:hypothetical protein HYX15_01445 [Candidatus Woesearchaeota archaeon]|nr:hypothetical protein [Candidatus Woesearchaeota archaeon]